MLEFISFYWLPATVTLFVFLLFGYFIQYYVRPALKLKDDLQRAIDGVKSAKAKSNNGIILTKQVQHSFSHNDDLLHLWKEYTETVHEQYAFINDQKQLIALRATVPAETFFNSAVIVNTKLNTEFFKHLPGILTGIGIIGTFTGLLFGLNGFSLDTSNEALSLGLKSLMSGVQEAFIASAIAILMAMIVTGVEKFILNNRYKQVEKLAQAIDELYNAGAGEEYLRELVESSQQNQAHTAQLKNAMVNDLKTMLENFSAAITSSFQSAIAEQTVKQEETNQKLVTALTDGMQPAIKRMEEAVQQLAGQQGAGVDKFIDAAIEGAKEQFGSQLRAFGDSLHSASCLLAENMPKITEAGSSMQQAGEKILNAGKSIEQAGNSTAKHISDAGKRFADTSKSLDVTAQSIIQAQTGISDLVQAASDTASKLSAVQDIFANLSNTIIELDTKTNQGSTKYQQGASDLAALQQPIQDAIKTLSSVAQSLTSDIVAPIQTALDAMKCVVVSGADNMNVAGQNLRLASIDAATSITSAGQSLSKDLSGSASGIQQAAQTFNQSATDWRTISSDIKSASELLEGATGGLQTATATVQGYLTSYEKQNKNLNELIKNVTDLVNQAQTRGKLGQEQVDQMTRLVSQMQQAQQEAAKFGEEVSRALTNAFTNFTKEMNNSSKTHTEEFEKSLQQAVKHVHGSVTGLSKALKDIKELANPNAGT